jgi:hypothetical protein
MPYEERAKRMPGGKGGPEASEALTNARRANVAKAREAWIKMSKKTK